METIPQKYRKVTKRLQAGVDRLTPGGVHPLSRMGAHS
jgi:hypothetical protein